LGGKIIIKTVFNCITTTLVAPLTRIKILQQMSPRLPILYIADGKIVNPTSVLRIGIEICKNEGFFNLWKGNYWSLCVLLTEAIVDELVAPYLRNYLVTEDPKNDFFKYCTQELLNELLVTSIKLLFLQPMYILRIRVQTDIWIRLFNAYGLRGIYRCSPLILLSNLSRRIIFISITELFRRSVKEDNISSWQSWFVRHISTQFTWLISYPVDTIACYSMALDLPLSRTYEVVRETGFGTFYKGIYAHVLTGIASSVFLLSLSKIKAFSKVQKRGFFMKETHEL